MRGKLNTADDDQCESWSKYGLTLLHGLLQLSPYTGATQHSRHPKLIESANQVEYSKNKSTNNSVIDKLCF